MQKLFLVSLVLLVAGVARAQKSVINDPNAEIRKVSGYRAIEVSNAINLYLSQGDEEAVAVSATDTKWRDMIHTDVQNGVLIIRLDRQAWKWHSGNKKLKAYVSFKNLDRLQASGASDVFVDGAISGDRLDLHLSGASDFKGAVKLNSLSIDQTGASDVTIKGIVGSLSIAASGASDTKGFELVTEKCSVQASGASDISITVNKELDARVSGASSVNYRGDAVIKESHSSGASSISRNG